MLDRQRELYANKGLVAQSRTAQTTNVIALYKGCGRWLETISSTVMDDDRSLIRQSIPTTLRCRLSGFDFTRQQSGASEFLDLDQSTAGTLDQSTAGNRGHE